MRHERYEVRRDKNHGDSGWRWWLTARSDEEMAREGIFIWSNPAGKWYANLRRSGNIVWTVSEPDGYERLEGAKRAVEIMAEVVGPLLNHELHVQMEVFVDRGPKHDKK